MDRGLRPRQALRFEARLAHVHGTYAEDCHTEETRYGLRDLPMPYTVAIERATAALKSQGFGVLTTIDVRQNLEQKLDRDFRPWRRRDVGRRRVTTVSGTLTWVRLAAAVGLVFSGLAIVAGTRVLTGRDVPGYPVLPWLVQYNVAAGSIGVVVALGVWWGRPWARLAAGAVAAVHGGVLLILVATRLAGGVVANDSLVAMTLRTTGWLGVALVAHRASRVRG